MKLAFYFLLSLFVLPSVAHASSGIQSTSAITPFSQYHQCDKRLNYDVYFHGQRIGNYNRHIQWQDAFKATVTTTGKANVLLTKSTLNMTSHLYWSDKKQQFVSQGYERKIKGLLSGKVTAQFLRDGEQSKLVVDKTQLQFASKDLTPILDGDAIGAQMRYLILKGEKSFEFNFQDTDEVNHYYFIVKGEEMINTRFGKLKAIRVEQTRKKDRKLVLWFAPSIDYQLVRATYHRKLLDLEAVLVSKNFNCH
ncbi:DUF3108 domain-containing protein [Photobacterium damselae]|uniref:DUF3108 domain-containing protein n=1 Tax=Photobacterium damselae TaxID=38293 RepID=UPI000D05F37A|nr:DUF3108 domain-containing protein [Photobacterium damselae]PSB91056.1 DUF3108 domain-containing protein [Photobacterium damselae subsp. damselae]